MKKRNIAVLTCVILFVIFLANAAAQIPQTIQYEGKLGSKGKAVPDGAYSMQFTIYDSAAGGASLWTETQQVQVTAGLFSALLGSVSPLNLSFDKQYWIGLSVNNDSEMTPRQTLSSVGYSFKAGSANYALTAGNADTVDTFHASATPAANTLLPLDANAKFPASVIDTTGLNADTLDGLDSTSFQKAITGSCAGQVITAINADGTVSCEADDTATGAGSSNADTVDTFHASSTPTANTLLPLDSSVKFPTSVLPLITDSEVSATANIAKSKLAPLAITDSDVSSISASKLNTTGATNMVTKIIAGTGVTLSPATGVGDVTINATTGGGGTVTSIATGTGLTGGPITATGTISIAPGGVTSTEIADGTITDIDIDTTKVQKRVSASCAGQVITAINADGTVTCETDDTGATGNFVDLQAGTPGTQQTGNLNISGTVIAGSFSGSGAGLTNIPQSSVTNITTDLAGKVSKSGDTMSGTLRLDVASAIPGLWVSQSAGGTAIYGHKSSGISNAIWGDVTGSSTAIAGYFQNTNTSNSSSVVQAWTSGTGALFAGNHTGASGNLLQLQSSGVDKFVVDKNGVITTGSVSNADMVDGKHVSDLNADYVNVAGDTMTGTLNLPANGLTVGTTDVVVSGGNLLVGNPTDTSPKLGVKQTGTGAANAGVFDIGNVTNSGTAVAGWTSGTGTAVWGDTSGTGYAGLFTINNALNSLSAVYGWTTGTGGAGRFEIFNFASSANVIYGNTEGTGNLLQLQKGGVDKFVVDNAGNITVGGVTDPNAVKKNPSSAQTIQPTADVVPLIIKDDAAATADLFDIQNNGGASLVKVASSGNLLVGSPAVSSAKVSALETGTINRAGYFEINNATNGSPAVYGYTSGLGNAGFFEINNATNGSPAVYGYTNGPGYAVYGYTAGPGTAISGYISGTGVAGYFGIYNATNGSPAVYGTTNGMGSAGYFQIDNATNGSAPIVGNTTGTGNLLQLQKSGVDKFVVDNGGYLTTQSNSIRIVTPKTPTGTADASGNVGDISWDDNYVYVKTSTGWKRTALAAW